MVFIIKKERSLTMLQRKTIVELAMEVERQKKSKHDYIVPSSAITMNEDTSITFGEGYHYKVGTVAHAAVEV